VKEPERFIRQNLPLTPVPHIPEIRLHLAQPSSRLSRLAVEGEEPRSPYWAFAWGGGLALARHILDYPELVQDKTVLDIGSGSGLVAIAAKLAGAADVTAVEIDPHGCAAIRLNAEANGVELKVAQSDPLEHAPHFTDLVTAGDVFYEERLAKRMLPLLQSLRDRGSLVLVGDPGRVNLPLHCLRRVADYELGDFASPGPAGGQSSVYMLADT
jgi:predicted nicotinamide N-methyase